MAGEASAIVRVRDEARELEHALHSLREQTVRPEIIVVDSGSVDGGLGVGRRLADRLIEIPPASFTYGHALNVGARAAGAPVHIALSAHCRLPRRDWVERALRIYERPEVAGAGGAGVGPDGMPIESVYLQTLADAEANPWWGLSNHASSWRASVWERMPFNEDLDYAEDKEWGMRAMRAGYLLAFTPELGVNPTHAWASAGEWYSRRRRAARAIASFAPVPPYSLADLSRDWWHDLPQDRHGQLAHRFFNYKRFAGLAGRYVGLRQARASARGDVGPGSG